VIARMNIGGPAFHVALLSGLLDPDRYETLLVAGRPGPGEGSFEALADHYGARLALLPSLGPQIDPRADLRSLRALGGLVRRFSPHIVHTHTAKAGALGRSAAVAASQRGARPLIVHTYHGHVLEGYFGPLVTGGYRAVERRLARYTDRLVGVSQATVDDLVRLGIAPRERFSVIPLGLDLDRLLALDPAARGTEDRDAVALYAGRLVPIKRVDLLIRALARARAAGARLRLVVLGDGELRASLERLATELGIAPHVSFLGYREDVTPYVAEADMAVLASANEGTPVALIEAGAGALPLVATRVGGVGDVVTPDTGRLVESGDESALAAAMAALAADGALRLRLGTAAREHVRGRFGAARLLDDVDRLYSELLAG
jgi:glycosyltransferase involved in cell wall biosynthesis